MSINIKEHGKEKKNCMRYRCPECKIKNAYFRVRTKDYMCQTCGCIFEILKEVPE